MTVPPSSPQPSLGQTRVIFQKLSRNNRTVHWRIDPSGLYTYISDVVEDLLGYHPDELVGKLRCYDLCPEEHRPAFIAAAEKILAAKSTFRDLENAARTKDGRIVWMSTHGIPLLGYNGELLGYEGWDTDITERKAAELRLKDLSERLLLAKRAARGGVWDWDLRRQTLTRDEDLLRMYGLPPDFRNDSYQIWSNSIHPQDLARVENEIQLALQGVQDYETEFRILLPDGTLRHLRGNAIVERDADGKPVRMVGMNWDITHTKDLEAQFLRAQRMESLGTLAGGVAHNLNNALTPILIATDLIRHQTQDTEILESLATIEASTRRCVSLVTQILSFARGVEGTRTPNAPGQLLEETVRMVRDTFPKNIQVCFADPGPLPDVLADPTQIHQVLLNLCVNARDAMPDGGTLTVSARALDFDPRSAATLPEGRPGPHVAFEVTDTGTGMSPAVLDRIFDPFFTTKDIGKGTGLGLSTARGIIQSHGGFWNITSQPGQGSRFIFYLPVCPPNTPSTSTRSSDQSTKFCHPGPAPHARILLVEDEAAVRDTLARILRGSGYLVETAEHGGSALELLDQRPHDFQLVVTDLMMPVMDGVKFLRALRARHLIPAIVLTAVDDPKLPPDLDVRCLAKPFETPNLLRVLHAALQQPTATRHSVPAKEIAPAPPSVNLQKNR